MFSLLLGGSWVVLGGLISRITIVITYIGGHITKYSFLSPAR